MPHRTGAAGVRRSHTLTTQPHASDSGRVTNQLPNNQEDREVYLREHNARDFIKAVTEASRQDVATIIMTVKAFAGEPGVLYVALEYAHHSGVTVTMAPPASERGEPRS